jgi:hypothetical protein
LKIRLIFKKRKYFLAKGILQIVCNRGRPFDEHAVPIKTSVCGDEVQVGIKILIFAFIPAIRLTT